MKVIDMISASDSYQMSCSWKPEVYEEYKDNFYKDTPCGKHCEGCDCKHGIELVLEYITLCKFLDDKLIVDISVKDSIFTFKLCDYEFKSFQKLLDVIAQTYNMSLWKKHISIFDEDTGKWYISHNKSDKKIFIDFFEGHTSLEQFKSVKEYIKLVKKFKKVLDDERNSFTDDSESITM